MIRVKDIEFSYTSVPFIQGVSIEVSAGEIFGFLDPSGAGKSTLQKILTGVLTTYGGSVIVNGVEVSKRTGGFYEDIGVDFEFPSLYQRFTAAQNLRFFGSLYRKELLPIADLLGMVGLEKDANKKVSDFSKGMKIASEFRQSVDPSATHNFPGRANLGLRPRKCQDYERYHFGSQGAGANHHSHNSQHARRGRIVRQSGIYRRRQDKADGLSPESDPAKRVCQDKLLVHRGWHRETGPSAQRSNIDRHQAP